MRTVVVICHGSINRSAFAGLFLKHLHPDLDIRVRCVKDEEGRRPTPKARAAAERLGLSFGEYRSKRLEPQDLWDADLVLDMDGGNRKRLLAYAEQWLPQGSISAWADHKVRGLYEFVGEKRIPDPNFMKTGSEEEIAVFSLIERAIRNVSEWLKSDKHP